MKNINLITAFTLLLIVAYSCNTTSKTQYNSKFNYDDLYKVWVVDTIIDLGNDDFSTPNIETDKNEYKFTKDDTNRNQGTRTTITPLGPSFAAPFTLEDGIINVDAMHPLLKIDDDMNLLPGSNVYGVPIPPYKIIELSPTKLTLKNKDITMKLKERKVIPVKIVFEEWHYKYINGNKTLIDSVSVKLSGINQSGEAVEVKTSLRIGLMTFQNDLSRMMTKLEEDGQIKDGNTGSGKLRPYTLGSGKLNIELNIEQVGDMATENMIFSIPNVKNVIAVFKI